MEQLLQDIWRIIGPTNMPWDIFIYILFFLSIVVVITIPDKNMQPNVVMWIVLLAVVVDKVRGSTGGDVILPGFDDRGFGTLMTHVIIAIFPFIAAGLIRGRKRNDKRGIPIAILTGIIGSLYSGLFFFSTGGLGEVPI